MTGDVSVIRALLVTILAALFALAPRVAHADDDVAKKGIAVVAAEGATDAAWPLARAIYGSAFLRPEKIDDEHARILAGDKRETQQPSIVELQELRAGVKGDDAASRQVLTAIAEKFGVASILVVFVQRDSAPYAELFDVRTHAFDAARYAPDANGSWEGTIRSLERPFLPAPTPIVSVSQTAAASNALLSPPKHGEKSKAFYESPWFWAAVGAVVLIGGGILIATNIQTGDTIHLQLKMP